jgi:hypothetical protein
MFNEINEENFLSNKLFFSVQAKKSFRKFWNFTPRKILVGLFISALFHPRGVLTCASFGSLPAA